MSSSLIIAGRDRSDKMYDWRQRLLAPSPSTGYRIGNRKCIRTFVQTKKKL